MNLLTVVQVPDANAALHTVETLPFIALGVGVLAMACVFIWYLVKRDTSQGQRDIAFFALLEKLGDKVDANTTALNDNSEEVGRLSELVRGRPRQ